MIDALGPSSMVTCNAAAPVNATSASRGRTRRTASGAHIAAVTSSATTDGQAEAAHSTATPNADAPSRSRID
ncbi:hypothetical protein Aab01nite_61220 [Paractinoplanes abujensis]|nr:hypothetical protein Aab01nite_61220 [Actinoplanes abujensis]